MKHDSLTSNTVGGVQKQAGRRMGLLITGYVQVRRQT